MKYLIILSLFLTGCMKSFTPATVEQLEANMANDKKTATIVSVLADQTAKGTPIATEAKIHAEQLATYAKPSGFDFMGESVVGILMTAMGLGGVHQAKKRIAIARAEPPPEEFNKKA